MANTVQFPCPNCGAPLQFDPTLGEVACQYCNGHFSVEEVEAAEQNKQRQRPERTPEEAELEGYHCQTCGAEVLTDSSTAATFCYYCHSPIVLESRLSGDFRPDEIVPFRLSAEDAKANLKAWMATKRFVPKTFSSDAQLDKMTGLYFPYWQLDVDYELNLQGEAVSTSTYRSGNYEVTESKRYRVDRHGPMTLEDLEEPGLIKEGIDEKLLQSIAPYEASDQKPYAKSYLAGYFAERHSRSREEVEAVFDQRLASYKSEIIDKVLSEYDETYLDKREMRETDRRWKLVLKPAYVLTFLYGGKTFVYAINGVTGKSFGELPLDQKRLNLQSLLIFLIWLLLLLLGGYFIW